MTHAVAIGPGAAIPLSMLTRHVGIFGATGTGKTTTAAALIERMAAAGVPCLVFDAKGDLESLGDKLLSAHLDLGAMGPDLIARALGLSDAQSGSLEIAFLFAHDQSLPLHTLGDLRHILGQIMMHRSALSEQVGLVSPASVAAVQRALLRLDRTAPAVFSGDALDPFAAAKRDDAGNGIVTVVRAGPLTVTPGLYGAAIAHILDTLFTGLTECQDKRGPALMIFIDESHLIFDGATLPIVRKLESIARLIRSKGIGLLFATQSPGDLPDAIMGQLATRIQHGLRGATARQMKEIRAAAASMPYETGFNATLAIKQLGTGQALVSVPDAAGVPGFATQIRVTPGRIAPEPVALVIQDPVAITPAASALIAITHPLLPQDSRPFVSPPKAVRKWNYPTLRHWGLIALVVYGATVLIG